jgi:hypothetical protein
MGGYRYRMFLASGEEAGEFVSIAYNPRPDEEISTAAIVSGNPFRHGRRQRRLQGAARSRALRADRRNVSIEPFVPSRLAHALVADTSGGFAAVVLAEDARTRRLRFLAEYDGALRVMAWMTVGRDASLYFNQRVRTTSNKILIGEGIADGDGGYAGELELQEREYDPERELRPKMSYHASGIVTHADRRTASISLRGINELTLIRHEMFANADRYDIVDPARMRKNDIIVPDPEAPRPFRIDASKRLEGRVFVGPLRDGEAQASRDPKLDPQAAVIVPFQNLEGCQDITVQITLLHGPAGRWPDGALTLVQNLEEAPPDQLGPVDASTR